VEFHSTFLIRPAIRLWTKQDIRKRSHRKTIIFTAFFALALS